MRTLRKLNRFVFLGVLSLGFSLQAAATLAQTLPLPSTLTSLTSMEGARRLQESNAQQDFLPLSSQFVTQINQAFCGVASIVMVLNAIGVPAPTAPGWDQHYFTQENVLNAETETVIPRATILRQGMTLAELAGVLERYPVRASVHYGSDVSLMEFRRRLVENLQTPGNFVLVNYLRRAIAQERGGHISPIAAYHAPTDSFLILDVSRYKYPPVWVNATDLWRATNTVDSVSGRTRGFLLITRR